MYYFFFQTYIIPGGAGGFGGLGGCGGRGGIGGRGGLGGLGAAKGPLGFRTSRHAILFTLL